MSEFFTELKKLSDTKLIETHDAKAHSTMVGTQHYLDELRYREQSKMTNQIWWFTAVVTIATLISTALTILMYFKPPGS